MRRCLPVCSVLLMLAVSRLAPAAPPAAAPAGGTPAAAAPAQSAATPSPLAQLLESQVRAAWEAFKRKDPAAYEKFLTDDFQAVESDGEGERSRRHVLSEVEHCMFTDYLLQMFQVQPLGPDYAFVTYESTMQFPKGSPLRLRRVFIGELWKQHGGRWQMMRYQETLVR